MPAASAGRVRGRWKADRSLPDHRRYPCSHPDFGNTETLQTPRDPSRLYTHRLARWVDSRLGTAKLVRTALNKVFPDPDHAQPKSALRRARSARGWSRHFFDEGRGTDLPGVGGTLWAAFNGVTEYVDHCVPQRKSKRQAEMLFNFFTSSAGSRR